MDSTSTTEIIAGGEDPEAIRGRVGPEPCRDRQAEEECWAARTQAVKLVELTKPDENEAEASSRGSIHTLRQGRSAGSAATTSKVIVMAHALLCTIVWCPWATYCLARSLSAARNEIESVKLARSAAPQ
ncbi:hypothetical protein LTR53_011915 [Teratosphaeriaceae sp. CCFEE 6253]|nr:hypothetical protein LTR53_011915 [Teratosphaeriaceae sp. CCFEE 6253]